MSPQLADIPVQQMLGVPLRATSMQQAVELAESCVASRQRVLVGVVNAAKIVNMQRDATLREAVLKADVIFADGMSVVWAGRILGRRLPERVAGIDLMERLLARANEKHYRVFLLGAAQEVLDAVLARIAAELPGVQLVGSHHGYFKSPDEEQLVAKIASSKPDMLFVAMSSPMKECFLARWADRLHAPVLHGVGGAFDVMAGKVRRAPAVWQRIGLEWLYRVLQEPGRLWRRYLVTNTLFVKMVLGELVGRWFGRRAASPRSDSTASSAP